jgi:hypothetical protein
MTVDLTARLTEQSLKAKAELQKRGVKLPPKPRDEMPRLRIKGPQRLSDLDDSELMTELVRFTRWQDYISGEYTLAEIDETVLTDAIEVAKALHLSREWRGPSDSRVRIAQANATIDNQVRDLTNQFLAAKARRKALGVVLESLDRDARVVSREITLRDGRRSTDRRVGRYEP